MKSVDEEIDDIMKDVHGPEGILLVDKELDGPKLREILKKRMKFGDDVIEQIADAAIVGVAQAFNRFAIAHPITMFDGMRAAETIMAMKVAVITAIKNGR